MAEEPKHARNAVLWRLDKMAMPPGEAPVGGRLLDEGIAVADVAAIRWTVAEGKLVPWTGWLTLAAAAKPLAAGRFTLELDGNAGPILLMAQALAGNPAPFCFAAAPPRCKRATERNGG
jgi:hypothetical protein